MDEVNQESEDDIFAEVDDFDVSRKSQQLINEGILVDVPETASFESISGPSDLKNDLLHAMQQTDVTECNVSSSEFSILELTVLKQLLSEVDSLQLFISANTDISYCPCRNHVASGVGKTYLVKSVARKVTHETDSTFYCIQSCSLMSRWLNIKGRITDIFRLAKETQPSILFFDDLDSLFGGLDPDTSELGQSMRSEFIKCIHSIESKTCVLAATNFPWTLHKDILDTFGKFVYIPLPDQDTRSALFAKLFSRCTNSLEAQDYVAMAEKSVGFTHSDIVVSCKQAMMKPWLRVQMATHFRRTQGSLLDNPDVESDQLLTPCRPDSPDAIEISFTDIDDDELLPPTLTKNDIMETLAVCKASLDEIDLKRIAQFQPPT